MRIAQVESISVAELLSRLKQVKLRGHEQALVYEHATLTFERGMDADKLWPAQAYVIKRNVARIHALREALKARGIDIFALEGACLVRADGLTDDGRPMPVLPPVVEETIEADGSCRLLINDGMHRVFAAREVGAPISIVLARNMPREFPYYAFPLEHGWADVQALDAAPPSGSARKAYRFPENHKALFRDFNAVFPGVQEDRKAAA